MRIGFASLFVIGLFRQELYTIPFRNNFTDRELINRAAAFKIIVNIVGNNFRFEVPFVTEGMCLAGDQILRKNKFDTANKNVTAA